MVETSTSVALISIHPCYAEAILDGLKRVEFRKVAFKRHLTHVVLYATCPIQRIVGIAQVDGIDERPPIELWRRYRSVGGIDREAFFTYFNGRRLGYGVRLCRPRRLKHPIRLDDLRPALSPPQSFLYGSAKLFERVRSACSDASF